MENNEILLELAQFIGQIVDKKVAEKIESVKPKLADAYKVVLEAIQNGTLENVADILDAIGSESKYDDEVEGFVRKQADFVMSMIICNQ